MPGRVTRSASWSELELFRMPSIGALQAVKSVVLDATSYTYVEGVRNVVPAGTILKKSLARPDKYITYNGSGTIEGVLLHYVDLAASASNADEAAPMVWRDAIFATEAIINFTNYAAALVSALPTCSFQ